MCMILIHLLFNFFNKMLHSLYLVSFFFSFLTSELKAKHFPPNTVLGTPHKFCYIELSLFTIMRNAGLDEVQAGIKIAGRNINKLRYADVTTLMAESEEELKSLLLKVKEESEKVG